MGIIESSINWFQKMFGDKEARILMLGLDNAGKTSVLCKIFYLIKINLNWMKML
jgi:signal recognition particle GTPase